MPFGFNGFRYGFGKGAFSIPNEIQDFLILGASIMDGSMDSVDLEPLMDATYPNSNCTVHNEQVGGWTVGILKSNIDSILATYTPTITDMVVIMHIGGGDVSNIRPYTEGTGVDNLNEDLDYIINAIEVAGYNLYLADLTYRNYADVETNNEANGSLPFNTNIFNPKTASDKKFGDSQSWMQLYTVAYNDISLLLADGVHYTAAGYEAIRHRVVDTIGYHNFIGRTPPRFSKTDFYVVPNAITDTALSLSNTNVTVTWSDDNINAYSYAIYRDSVLVATKPNVLGNTSDYSIIDDASSEGGNTVTYEVRAVNDTGESVGNVTPQIFIDVPVILSEHKVKIGNTASAQDDIYWISGIADFSLHTPQSILDIDGVDLGYTVSTDSGFGGKNTDGASTGDNSGYLRDIQLADSFYSTSEAIVTIGGLDDTATYTLRISGSRITTDDRETKVTINTVDKFFYSSFGGTGTTDDGVQFDNLISVGGAIDIIIDLGSVGAYAYIGGFDLIQTS